MLLIVGTFRMLPETLPAARETMARMIAASRAEDGCEDYAYAEDLLDPGLIRVSERWRDQAALDQHFSSEHIAAWRASAGQFGIHDRNLMLYGVAEARPL